MKKAALLRTAAPTRRSIPLRRKLANDRARVRVVHAVLPGHEVKHAEAFVGERIADFLIRNGWAHQQVLAGRSRWCWRLPTVCEVNGKPLLQRQWKRRRISERDQIAFVSRPLGGGRMTGKQIAGIVGAIALAAFAPWAGGVIATTLGLGAAGGFAASLIAGAIMVGGSLLLATLIKPKATGAGAEATDQVDRLYAVQAQGNTARLFAPIPVQYGRLKIIPDYAALPWSEYVGNDQYLNILLSRGSGKYQVAQVLTEDTVVWDSETGYNTAFPDVEIEHYDPGDTVDLFPTNILTSIEVSGQETTAEWLGGYVANTAGTQANALAVDLVFPSGCFNLSEDTGQIGNQSVTIQAEARLVNNAGAPIGSYVGLFSKTYTYATRSQIRLSEKVTVAPGRWEVRVRRTDEPITNGSNVVIWAGLRSFLMDAPSSYPCSTTAIRIRASSFTQAAARKFGVIQTRILPVFNTETEEWVEQPTRNLWWAFHDAATNAEYGPRRPVSTIDFQTIVTNAAASEARGKTFDYQFASTVAVPEAFDTILKPDRARHRWSGDRLSAVRDVYREIPRMLLTDREIVRGSVGIDYALNVDDAADCVIIEYADQTTWRPDEVQYPPNSEVFTAQRPARFRLDGIVDRDNAYEEAAFFYKQNIYRRVFVHVDTEFDGKLLGFGDTVGVQTELPESWGQGGGILGWDELVLQADRALDWSAGEQYYISVRDKHGRPFGPVKCAGVEGDNTRIEINGADLVLVEAQQGRTLADAFDRADGAEDPSFSLGIGTKRERNCLVLRGRPSGDRVMLDLVINSPSVYPVDLTGLPDRAELPALRDPVSPIIYQLTARFRQGVAEPIVDASWWPAAGAQYYRADASYDEGGTWTPIYEGIENSFSAVVDHAAIRIRVQGVNEARRGAYSTVDLDAPEIKIAGGTVSLESMVAGLQDLVDDQFRQSRELIEQILQATSQAIIAQDTFQWIEKTEQRRLLALTRNGLSASIEEVMTVAIASDAAIASLTTTVSSHTSSLSSLNASVTSQASAITTLQGYAAAAYSLTLDVNGYVSGMQLVNGGGGISAFTVLADYFQVAKPGVSGGTAISVFQIATVGGSAKVALRGDMLADGTITAAKIGAGEVTAAKLHADVASFVTANVTNLTATNINSNFAIYNKMDESGSGNTGVLTTYATIGAPTNASGTIRSFTYTANRNRVWLTGVVKMAGTGYSDGDLWIGSTSFLLKLQVYNGSMSLIYEYTMANLTGASARPSQVNNQQFNFAGTLLPVTLGDTITIQYNYAVSTGGVYGGSGAINFRWDWSSTATVLFEPRGT